MAKERVDFSDRISKALRTGYDARTCEWELAGYGEKETSLQKYQRLKCEMAELVEEVGQLKGSVKEDMDSAAPAVQQVQKLLQQLNEMKLEEQLGSKLVTSLIDPQGASFRKLLAEVEAIESVTSVTGGKPAAKTPSKADGGVITYELMYKPDHERLVQTTRVAQLEQRLHTLESAIGDIPGKLVTVQSLSIKTSVLDSAQLDHIEGRLTALATKMNQISEQSASKEICEQEQKISELYDLALKCENLFTLLPQVTERMAAIQVLQEQALTFNKSLAQLDGLQEQISATLGVNDASLKDVQKNFSQNMVTIKNNMSSLDARIAALKKK
ncbi:hypothetical protein B566_EDAN004722 [Ephemera danica]|nr:hypothetical protein B566_EDAN004722 [Ephemera danica]